MTDNQTLPPSQGPEYARCRLCGHIQPAHRPDAGPCLECDCTSYSTAVPSVPASRTPAALRESDEEPLSPYYEHPACGFHWHGRDGMDIPVQEDGQPVCPRCELAKVQKQLDYTQRRRDEVGAECKRRGKIKLEQAETIARLERQLDEVRSQLGAEILRAGQAEGELRRLAAVPAAEEQPFRSDVGTEFVQQLDRLDGKALDAVEADLAAEEQPDNETPTVPPAAAGLPLPALDSATTGASALDAWARDPRGRNFLAHALVGLARDGWLRRKPSNGFEPGCICTEDAWPPHCPCRADAPPVVVPHACRNCEGIDPDTCLMNPARTDDQE